MFGIYVGNQPREKGEEMMNWQKRKCPISMKLMPQGSGWEEIELVIEGKCHKYYVTEVYPDGFWALVNALYVLYPRREYFLRKGRDVGDGMECIDKFKDGQYICTYPYAQEEYAVAYRTCAKNGFVYTGNEKRVEFAWDEEDDHGVAWSISRHYSSGVDFDITLELKEWDENNMRSEPPGTYTYTVSYSDFCYAVGKAVTEAVKSYGFGGFAWSTSCVDVHQLCFLKACGMGKPWFFGRIMDEEHACGEKTSFKDEMEVLDFDM